MVEFIVKLAYQIMFWFNQLMGSGLGVFQVVMMTQLQLSHQPLRDKEDAWLIVFCDFWVAIISDTISH